MPNSVNASASANALAMLTEVYRELAGVLEAADPPPLRLAAVFEIAVRIEAGLEDPAEDLTAFPFVIPPDAVLEDPAGYVEQYVQERQGELLEYLQEWTTKMRAWTPDMPCTPVDDALSLFQGELTGQPERWQTALTGTLTGSDRDLLTTVRDAACLHVGLEAIRLIEAAQDLQRQLVEAAQDLQSKVGEQLPDLPPIGDPPDIRLEMRRLQGLLRRLRRRTRPPAETHSLQQQRARVIAVPMDRTTHWTRLGLQDGTQWPVDQQEIQARYTAPDGSLSLTIRETRQVESDFEPLDLLERLRARLASLDDIQVDLFDIATAAALEQNDPLRDPTVLYVDTVLKMRGRKPTGSYWQAMREYGERLYMLSQIHVDGIARHIRKGREVTTAYHAPLIKLAGYGPPLQPPLDHQRSQPIGFIRYTLGDWAQPLCTHVGKAEFGYMLRRCWELDPSTHWMHKRILRYLCWLWRCRASTRTWANPVTVHTLLENAGLFNEALTQHRNKHGARWRATFDRCLNTLQKREDIAGWCYESTGDTDHRALGLPYRGSFEVWLQQNITIHPPTRVTRAYHDLASRKRELTRGNGKK